MKIPNGYLRSLNDWRKNFVLEFGADDAKEYGIGKYGPWYGVKWLGTQESGWEGWSLKSKEDFLSSRPSPKLKGHGFHKFKKVFKSSYAFRVSEIKLINHTNYRFRIKRNILEVQVFKDLKSYLYGGS